MMKKKGIGLFATKTLSADLAAICGKNKMARPEVVKALWAYIKKNKLSKGRTITPDAKLKKVLPAASSAGCAFRTDRTEYYNIEKESTAPFRVPTLLKNTRPSVGSAQMPVPEPLIYSSDTSEVLPILSFSRNEQNDTKTHSRCIFGAKINNTFENRFPIIFLKMQKTLP